MGHVLDPALTEILGVMYDLINKKDDKKKEGGTGDAAGKAKDEGKTEEKKAAALTQRSKVNLAVENATNEAAARMQSKGISEEAMNRMVDAAIANGKNKPQEEQNATGKEG